MELNSENRMNQGEAAKVLGLSNDLLRLYEKEFDLKVDRSPGGHRRYSPENIQEIRSIKKMIQEQKLSYKDVRNIRAGLMPAVVVETAASLTAPDELKTLREKVERMEENMAKLVTLSEAMTEKIEEQQQYIEGALEKRQQALMLEIRTRLEEKQKKRPWWKRN